MRDYLEGGRGNHMKRAVVANGRGRFQHLRSPGKFARPGESRDRKLRAVCKACNNTWMSALQNAAKPLLVPLITGQWLNLDAAQQRLLAAWATMFSIVLDAVHPENSAISQQERTSFMNTLAPPANWLIWMGVCDKPMSASFIHDVYAAATLEEINQVPAGASLKNDTQATAFTCGHALFHTVSTIHGTEPWFARLQVDTDRFRIVKVWPLNTAWPKLPPQAIPRTGYHLLLERVARVFGLPGRR